MIDPKQITRYCCWLEVDKHSGILVLIKVAEGACDAVQWEDQAELRSFQTDTLSCHLILTVLCVDLSAEKHNGLEILMRIKMCGKKHCSERIHSSWWWESERN